MSWGRAKRSEEDRETGANQIIHSSGDTSEQFFWDPESDLMDQKRFDVEWVKTILEVSEGSERAFLKTKLTKPNFLARFARPSLKMRLASLGAERRQVHDVRQESNKGCDNCL